MLNKADDFRISVDEVINILISNLEENSDSPEVWNILKDLGENLLPITRTLRMMKDRHRKNSEAVPIRCLWAVSMAYSGNLNQAKNELEGLMVNNSQSPLVQGALFRVNSIIDPYNDKYNLEEKICPVPFTQIDILEKSSHLCCASWLSIDSGDMNSKDWYFVWNSNNSKKVRQSILDGSYRYCAKISCPAIHSQALKPFAEQTSRSKKWHGIIKNREIELETGPEIVNLAYDPTCNLSCPSCRKGIKVASKSEMEKYDQMQKRNIYPLLKTAKTVILTGSGDPFASRTYRKLLKWISESTCPNLKIILMSNGMLFTPEQWEKYPNLKGKVRKVKISIDGASKDTHELLRRGSSWEKMMTNMTFIGKLKINKEIDNYELVFTVQKDNYKEMGESVDLAKGVNANSVYFARLTNWGTFSSEEYKDKAVFFNEHQDFNDFLDQMKDNRLRDPIVDLGDLSHFIR